MTVWRKNSLLNMRLHHTEQRPEVGTFVLDGLWSETVFSSSRLRGNGRNLDFLQANYKMIQVLRVYTV